MMITIKNKKDIEAYDFIITTIIAYSNCDTWGDCGFDEKQRLCDNALSFLYKYIKVNDNGKQD